MYLNFEQIKQIAKGYTDAYETESGYKFMRFTDDEMNTYKYEEAYYDRAEASAGIRLDFYTDSKTLSFEYSLKPLNIRSKLYFDIFVNGNLIMHPGGDAAYITGGRFDINLCNKESHIEIFFPCNAVVYLKNIVLSENSNITSRKNEMFFISYGDSITQGYDAFNPSDNYVSALARHLNADFINKGVGGDVMNSENLRQSKKIPDFITIAYGTNDWCKKKTVENFTKTAADYYKTIAKLYENIPIFVITPIWRADKDIKENRTTDFENIGLIIEDLCSQYQNMYIIDGMKLTPHDTSYYADGRLHPNSDGFLLYAENLYKEIEKYHIL